MKDIPWGPKKAWVQDISLRSRKNQWTKNIEPYAVITITHEDTFDETQLIQSTKKTHKKITLMCFQEILYKRLVVGDRFSFSGFISFGYGNTFLVVTKIKDDLGFYIEHEESVYFANYSPDIRPVVENFTAVLAKAEGSLRIVNTNKE